MLMSVCQFSNPDSCRMQVGLSDLIASMWFCWIVSLISERRNVPHIPWVSSASSRANYTSGFFCVEMFLFQRWSPSLLKEEKSCGSTGYYSHDLDNELAWREGAVLGVKTKEKLHEATQPRQWRFALCFLLLLLLSFLTQHRSMGHGLFHARLAFIKKTDMETLVLWCLTYYSCLCCLAVALAVDGST